MDAAGIEQLLDALGAGIVKYSRGWINTSCPFAEWKHPKGSDRHPSFGISVHSESPSHTRCFCCHFVGDLKQLLWTLVDLRGRGEWWEKACKIVAKEKVSFEELERRDPAVTELSRRISKIKDPFTGKRPRNLGGSEVLGLEHLKYDLLPETVLDEFFTELSPEADAYLKGPRRKLTDSSIVTWGLRWQPNKRRIAIPVRDWHGGLVCISGRSLDVLQEDGSYEPERRPKFLHSEPFRRDFFLFGEHLVKKGEPGILVEGHFDAIYLTQMGFPNTVAAMGAYPSKIQVEKIIHMFSEVTIFPDGDEVGGQAAERWEHALKGRVPVRVLTVYTDRDPDDYDEEELFLLFDHDDSE